MNNSAPQSWFDLPLAPPGDPRSVVQGVFLDDNAGVATAAAYAHSISWLHNTTWVQPPLALATTGNPFAVNLSPQDFDAQYAVQQWNSQHGIIRPSNQIALPVQRMIFTKLGAAFSTTFFLDWTPAVTSTDIQLSFRDNSATSGDFQNGASGTVPVFAFPTTSTFGGLGRKFTITTPHPGRFDMCLRILDSAANWSMFEMQWIVLS